MDASYLDLMMAQQEETFGEAEGGGGVWISADITEKVTYPKPQKAIGAARTLADALGAYVYAVLLGDDVTSLAETLYQAGADRVYVVDHPALASFAVETYGKILGDLFEEHRPEIVLFNATDVGQALAPRLAHRLGGGLIEHVTAVALDETTRAVKATVPVYGGEYFEIRTCREARPQFLTIEPGAFPDPFLDEYRKGEPTMVDVAPKEPAVRVLGPAEGYQPPDLPLSEAKAVVAGGRQAGSFELVERLAMALHAHVAGDRGAWDAGLIDAKQMVDVRGVTVSPDLYVALGIRGDTFHNAAMAEAKFIVAVHPDPQAPLFEVADLCVEADPEEVLPALLAALT